MQCVFLVSTYQQSAARGLTWQLELLGLITAGKALGQIQVSITAVLHDICTVEITMREANLDPGSVQVAENLQAATRLQDTKGKVGQHQSDAISCWVLLLREDNVASNSVQTARNMQQHNLVTPHTAGPHRQLWAQPKLSTTCTAHEALAGARHKYCIQVCPLQTGRVYKMTIVCQNVQAAKRSKMHTGCVQ